VTGRRVPRTLAACAALIALSSATTLALASRRIVAEQAAYSLPAAARCTPTTLNRSALLPGTSLAVSPLPDSYDASPRTQISLLGAPPSDLLDVTVSGSQTGSHAGRLLAYSQGDGASFVPSKPFAPGETVTVRGKLKIGARATQLLFHFVVATIDVLPYSPPSPHPDKDPDEVQHFHSRPELQPPAIAVSVRSPGTAAGYLFAAPYAGPGPSGPLIFNEAGEAVWFDPLPTGTEATNLQVQSYDGQPVLTWWQGTIPPQGFGEGEDIIDNSSYQQIGRVHAGNGYKADLHDFHLMGDNTALLTVFDPIRCDLSAVGGPAGGAVTDSIFQEVDLKTGLVRREWHSLDHVPLSDSYSSPQTASTEWPFDYFHLNSIDQGADGTTLISARNTSALYELNTMTGQVLTAIGGKHSDVKLAAGATTAFQHDATTLSNGTISIFDNGAAPKVHPQSRGIVVAVNPKTDTDSVVAEYDHPGSLSSSSQGNVELLENGDVFVGWGAEPYFSEFSASGTLLFDAHMRGAYQSYRGYRFQWTGTPSEPPAVAVARSGSGAATSVTVYASWNGDTRTASWRVLGGPSAQQLTPVAGAARSGFETTIALPAAPAYVAAQALGANGEVLGTSRVIAG
jgi:Arylsulfotransferase (ASST)